MGRMVRDDRKATVTQITTHYNQYMQNTISECTTRRTREIMRNKASATLFAEMLRIKSSRSKRISLSATLCSPGSDPVGHGSASPVRLLSQLSVFPRDIHTQIPQ